MRHCTCNATILAQHWKKWKKTAAAAADDVTPLGKDCFSPLAPTELDPKS
jgi:hypothetical protein